MDSESETTDVLPRAIQIGRWGLPALSSQLNVCSIYCSAVNTLKCKLGVDTD